MSDQEGYDRKEALASFTEDIGNRIFQGSMKTESLSSACIYRVPQDLRELNQNAYTPRVIAIGPLHREDPHLPKTMQPVKMYYANYLFVRSIEGIQDEGKRMEKKIELLQQCVEKMKELVDRAKKCYAEEDKVKGDDEMAEMMLVDGCFILQLLCASYCDKENKEAGKRTTKGGDSGNSKASSSSVHQLINEVNSDPIIDHILTAKNIKRDLLLLENQIPFFVLEELFKLTVDKIPDDKIPGGKKLSLTEYVISYFGDIMISPPDDENSGSQTKTGCSSPGHCVFWVRDYSKENEPKGKIQWEKRDHILHLLHDYYRPDERREDEKNSAKKFCESDTRASELCYGGVKFVPVEKKNLFDVGFRERKSSWWFDAATFDIPTLSIRDHTETFLRNLIAYEQLGLGVPRYFTSYAKLMDVLINSEKDVQVLTNAKVIENYLDTDKDVFYLFKNLCKEIVTEDFYFSKECEQAFNFTERNWWQKSIAYVRRLYFDSPWQFIGSCLAYIGFVMQVNQFSYDSLK